MRVHVGLLPLQTLNPKPSIPGSACLRADQHRYRYMSEQSSEAAVCHVSLSVLRKLLPLGKYSSYDLTAIKLRAGV